MDDKILDSMSDWKEYFFGHTSKVLSPHEARLEEIKEKNLPVEFFCIELDSVEGLSLKLQESEQNSKISLNLSLFDASFKRFYGITWPSPGKKVNKSSGKLELNELSYFSTALKDEHILIVIEIVINLKERPKSCGWTFFRPFNSEKESKKRLGFYYGTPRAIFFMEEPFETCPQLKEIFGLYLNYKFSNKPKLAALKQFLPENVFLGRLERIGGIFTDSSVKCKSIKFTFLLSRKNYFYINQIPFKKL